MASMREYLIVMLECPGLPPKDHTYRGQRMVVVNTCYCDLSDRSKTFRFMLHLGALLEAFVLGGIIIAS